MMITYIVGNTFHLSQARIWLKFKVLYSLDFQNYIRLSVSISKEKNQIYIFLYNTKFKYQNILFILHIY